MSYHKLSIPIFSLLGPMTKEVTRMASSNHRARVFGRTIVLNANAKRGYRISPGVNWRARQVQKCAKGKSLEQRKLCFGGSGHKKAKAKSE